MFISLPVMRMNLLLLRHGEIPSNINKIYAGFCSEGLTDRGIRQAHKIAEKLAGFKSSAIYTSPIQRAVQTAKIIREKLNVELKISTDFRELQMGPWEGLSETEIAQKFPVTWGIWNSKPAELKLPGRETLDELLKRVLTGIQKITRHSEEENTIIVTHVAVIRVLLLWHARKDLNLYKTIYVPNAKIFKIEDIHHVQS